MLDFIRDKINELFGREEVVEEKVTNTSISPILNTKNLVSLTYSSTYEEFFEKNPLVEINDTYYPLIDLIILNKYQMLETNRIIQTFGYYDNIILLEKYPAVEVNVNDYLMIPYSTDIFKKMSDDFKDYSDMSYDILKQTDSKEMYDFYVESQKNAAIYNAHAKQLNATDSKVYEYLDYMIDKFKLKFTYNDDIVIMNRGVLLVSEKFFYEMFYDIFFFCRSGSIAKLNIDGEYFYSFEPPKKHFFSQENLNFYSNYQKEKSFNVTNIFNYSELYSNLKSNYDRLYQCYKKNNNDEQI